VFKKAVGSVRLTRLLAWSLVKALLSLYYSSGSIQALCRLLAQRLVSAQLKAYAARAT
jgi:hypothetical protein